MKNQAVGELACARALGGASPSHGGGLAMPKQARGTCSLESAAGHRATVQLEVRNPAVDGSASGRALVGASPRHYSVWTLPEQARDSCCLEPAAGLQSHGAARGEETGC